MNGLQMREATKMDTKRRVVLVLMLVALLYLVATGGRTTPYMSVEQLVDDPVRWEGRLVRVRGELVAGSLSLLEGDKTPLTRMILREGGTELITYYQGLPPEQVQPGGQLVAEGRLDEKGAFRAERILVECPSRYTPHVEEEEGEGGEELGV